MALSEATKIATRAELRRIFEEMRLVQRIVTRSLLKNISVHEWRKTAS